MLENSELHHEHKTRDFFSCLRSQNCTMNTIADIWAAWEFRTAAWTQSLRFELLGNSELTHEQKTCDLSCSGIQNYTMNTKLKIWAAWEFRTAPWTQNLIFELLGNSELHHEHKTLDLSCLGIQNCTMNT